MINITLRSATLEDLPILYTFEQGVVSAERPFDSTLKSGHINYYNLKAMIQSNNTEVVVAVDQGKIVGSACGY